ncbi:MAG: Gfo/Idh/MocA family oxidoreductase [Devosia sp.]
MRIGLVGVDSSHAEHYLRLFNSDARYGDIRVTALWGGTPDRTRALLDLAPPVAASGSLEELIADVDAVIVGDRHGDLHRQHALPAIAAGKPVFIDKPLANRDADATAIIEAAAQAGTALLSASALRWQLETQLLKTAIAGLSGPFSIEAYGTWYPDNEYGGAVYYGIHTVELLQEMLGPDWSNLRLEAGGAAPRLRYETGAASVGIAFNPLDETGSSAFGVRLATLSMAREQPIPLGDDYMVPVANRIAAMLTSGRGAMTAEQLVAPVRMMAEIDRLLAER